LKKSAVAAQVTHETLTIMVVDAAAPWPAFTGQGAIPRD